MDVYINYPEPHFTIHHDASCQQIQMHKKTDQRRIQIRPDNLEAVLNDFMVKKYAFKAEKMYNDMWLDISLDTKDQELKLVGEIRAILGRRYKPLGSAPVNIHCK